MPICGWKGDTANDYLKIPLQTIGSMWCSPVVTMTI
jgi:hypothetical protein